MEFGRLEYKFLVPNEMLDCLREALTPYIRYDRFAENRDNRQYTVRSIYFDTMKLDYYVEKIEGLKIRKKLRIRGYNTLRGEKIVYLEIKRKNQNFITKNRAPVLYSDLQELFHTGNVRKYVLTKDPDSTHIEDCERFFFHMINKSLNPTVLVTYDREAYHEKFNSNLRITFDKNLRFCASPNLGQLFDEDVLKPAMKNNFIFEIKFYRGYPAWLQKIIMDFGLNRMALSKYTISLDEDEVYNPVSSLKKTPYDRAVYLDGFNYRRYTLLNAGRL